MLNKFLLMLFVGMEIFVIYRITTISRPQTNKIGFCQPSQYRCKRRPPIFCTAFKSSLAGTQRQVVVCGAKICVRKTNSRRTFLPSARGTIFWQRAWQWFILKTNTCFKFFWQASIKNVWILGIVVFLWDGCFTQNCSIGFLIAL